ncbi:MAG: hypothetical protein O3C21_04880 [Verrucomicrobia bacterium]|nr:hypothetical protein [Verrucomicrobiota bacterium]
MKSAFLCQMLLIGMFAGPSLGDEIRTFSTADGSKVIKAAITQILPSKDGKRYIEITREDNGKRYNVLAEVFSADDQAYIEETVALMESGRNLSVSIKPNEDRGSAVKAGGRSVVTAKHTFDIELRNNSETAVEGIEVSYKVFYKKAERVWETKGTQSIGTSKRVDAYKDNKVEVATVKPRESHTFSTVPVSLTHDRPNRGGPG